MFSLWQRVNALATFSILLLAALSCAASFLDAFNSPSVIKVNRFRKQLTGNDEVFVFLTAEYETSKNSVNQISLWDHIVPDKDNANFRGNNLRGKRIDLVLHWHVMPKTGRMIRDKMALSEFYLPDAYT
ncbi:putative signal peptidase complex subunit 3 [Ananas comosus]|uniref:Signal peptidase complex subunit 3 n=1 Tax=Ananas comosus TaxID=4615 RepID=A0A199VMB3_ANACO|nr:putative signal peptidase complex subunit 3 [Ananas comosus]